MRVTLVHDYLTQRGGAERVVLAMARAFPGCRILTSLYEPDSTYPEFSELNVVASSLNRLAVLRNDHRRALPLLASTFERLRVEDADVVLCSSSGWSHRIRTAVPKVVYCHNPPRWLYQPDDYYGPGRSFTRTGVELLSPWLRRTDVAAARTAAIYLANSSSVARRVSTTYGITAEVLAPPVALSPDGPQEQVKWLPESFFLTVARARGYKHTDTICAAFRQLSDQHLVVVGGRSLLGSAKDASNITVLDRVSDAELRWLYASSRAVICTAHEDFGLTPIEANAMGTPALTIEAGGFLDNMIPGQSGYFFPSNGPAGVIAGVRRLLAEPISVDVVRAHAAHFSEARFGQRLRKVLERSLTGERAAVPHESR